MQAVRTARTGVSQWSAQVQQRGRLRRPRLGATPDADLPKRPTWPLSYLFPSRGLLVAKLSLTTTEPDRPT
jgi:hypothetical protein